MVPEPNFACRTFSPTANIGASCDSSSGSVGRSRRAGVENEPALLPNAVLPAPYEALPY